MAFLPPWFAMVSEHSAFFLVVLLRAFYCARVDISLRRGRFVDLIFFSNAASRVVLEYLHIIWPVRINRLFFVLIFPPLLG